ncbi:hypothetical protein KY289_036779 [Solanum tuberosum]|nr:hypothetical protein KY289_036779 [Solanum tuberosum]
MFPFIKEKTSFPIFKDTHSTLDHSSQWSSIPIYQSEQCTSVEGRSRTTNDETREEDQHNGELRVGLNEEPLHELRAELNEEPFQVSVQPPTDTNQQNRKSARSSKPPIWMKDFVSLNIHKGLGYSIQNYMSYDKISYKYNAYIAAFSNNVEPKSYAEAATNPRWIEAMKFEIEALQNNHTWDIVTLPEGKTPIGCKWIFKIKYKSTGEVERFKARLVAKGYNQQDGIDY